MARILDSFPTPAQARYPWDEWLDGQPRQFEEGTDYRCKTSTLRTNAGLQAAKRGGTLKSRVMSEPDGDVLFLQFVPRR